MKKKLIKDKLGFIKVKENPSKQELRDYYQKKYYNQEKNYKKKYSIEEINYIKNKLNQKYILVKNNLSDNKKKLLELGSGEGWVLDKFNKNGFEVVGIDYSNDGCKNQNPHVLDKIIIGDLEEYTYNFDKNSFDIIWLENVLEHVLEPKKLIKNLFKILKKEGLIAVVVPNDFSIVQKDLIKRDKLKNNEYWVSPPDHLSYFNKDSLVNIFSNYKFKLLDMISDFPIDLELYSESTNYIDNPKLGSKAHQKRMEIENLFSSISDEKTNNLFRAFADLGIGRDLFAIFKKI